MYTLNISSYFSAAHQLHGYPGECANLHGHNWKVRLSVDCTKHDELGMAIDFKILKQRFDTILQEFDHKELNALPLFVDKNPTSERIAQVIFEKATEMLNNDVCHVREIEVWESEKYSVIYSPSCV